MLSLLLCVASCVTAAGEYECWESTGRIAIVSMLDTEHKDWLLLRQNRLELARFNGYAYCEYIGQPDTSRPAAWNKLRAVWHALLGLGYDGVWWLDADMFAPEPRRRLDSVLKPLTLSQLDCVFSLDMVTGPGVTDVNSGVFYFARNNWTMTAIRSIYDAGYEATRKTCAATYYEQCALRWYVGQNKREFARFPARGTHCTVLAFGTLQTFPHHKKTHKSTALFYHYAGDSTHRDRIAYVAQELKKIRPSKSLSAV